MKLPNDVKHLKQMVATLLHDNKALTKQNKKMSKALDRIYAIANMADVIVPKK